MRRWPNACERASQGAHERRSRHRATGSSGASRCFKILPDVIDRVAEQFAHADFGDFRRAVANGLENAAMLMQAIVLDLRRALPAQFERALERGADEAAEGGGSDSSSRMHVEVEIRVISGPLENAHVEVEIGPDQIARAVLELVHTAVGVLDPIDRGGECAFAANAAASGSTIWRRAKSSATKLSVGVDCKCQDSTSGSSTFQSALGRTRVPIFGRATIIALAVSTL